jgi:hypothetical protein
MVFHITCKFHYRRNIPRPDRDKRYPTSSLSRGWTWGCVSQIDQVKIWLFIWSLDFNIENKTVWKYNRTKSSVKIFGSSFQSRVLDRKVMNRNYLMKIQKDSESWKASRKKCQKSEFFRSIRKTWQPWSRAEYVRWKDQLWDSE